MSYPRTTIIVVLIGLIWSINHFSDKESYDYSSDNIQSTIQSPERYDVFKFVLTEMLGEKIPKPASFYVYTKSTEWVLDYNNGDKITYSLISGNEFDPLCGLKARDSFGDICEICIKSEGTSAIVTITYGNKRIVYRGYKE